MNGLSLPGRNRYAWRIAPLPLTPMIKTLHIENYRSIRHQSLELEQLNIVFGPNGTGKSNIYKAIHLMHSAAQGQFSQIGRAHV